MKLFERFRGRKFAGLAVLSTLIQVGGSAFFALAYYGFAMLRQWDWEVGFEFNEDFITIIVHRIIEFACGAVGGIGCIISILALLCCSCVGLVSMVFSAISVLTEKPIILPIIILSLNLLLFSFYGYTYFYANSQM